MGKRIEISLNPLGKYDLSIGDVYGSTTSSNLTHQEVIQEVSEVLENLSKITAKTDPEEKR